MSFLNEEIPKRGHGSEPKQLVIGAWHTECGDCGYGCGGWMASPALRGKPILTPESRECPGCGVCFTHSLDVYSGARVDFAEAA